MDDIRVAAEAALPPPVAAYAASGAEPGGAAAGANVAAWASVALVPRVLRPVATVSPATVLMGVPLATPLFIAPFGVHALAHGAGPPSRGCPPCRPCFFRCTCSSGGM